MNELQGAVMLKDQFLQKHLLEFFERGQELRFVKDEIIVRPGEDPGGVFLLKSGYVTVYTITNYGETNLLLINKPDEMFPLSASLGGRMPTTYRQAKTNIVVKRLSRAAFLSGVQNNATLSQAVNQQLLELTNAYEDRIKELEFRSARERIMARLYLMADRYGITRNNEIMLNVPITHQDIADSLNMTRETASREIERLAREGIIEQQNRLIIIKKIQALKKLFE